MDAMSAGAGGGGGGGGMGGMGAQGMGAGLGSMLGMLKWIGDIQANKNDRAVAATQSKWAPFTGQSVGKTRKANFLQAVMQGAQAGADFGGKNKKGLASMWDQAGPSATEGTPRGAASFDTQDMRGGPGDYDTNPVGSLSPWVAASMA